MPPARQLIILSAVAAVLAACASNGIEGTAASFTPAGEAVSAPSPGGYALSDTEKNMNCKRLTGMIQIRILELRTYTTRTEASTLARSLQEAGTPVFGGTTSGIDPKGEHARDLAQIDAYNRELAARNCPSFDLGAALAGNDTPPAPTVRPHLKASTTSQVINGLRH